MNFRELHLNGPWWAAHLKTCRENVTCAVHCEDTSPDLDPRVPLPAGSCNSFHASSHLRCFYVKIRSAFRLLSHGFDWSDSSSGGPVCVEWKSNESGSWLVCAVSPSRSRESCAPSSLFWASEWDIVSGQRRACDLSRGVLLWSIKMNGGKEREGGDGRGHLAQVPIGWQRKVETAGVLYIRYE